MELEGLPLEAMINSQEESGLPNISRQIFFHMDFGTLLNCRTTSKTVRDFLDHQNQKQIWIQTLEKVSQEQDCAEEIRNSPRERFIRFDEFFFVQNFSFLLTKNL